MDLTIRINAISILVISLKQNPQQEFLPGLVLTSLQTAIYEIESYSVTNSINKVRKKRIQKATLDYLNILLKFFLTILSYYE